MLNIIIIIIAIFLIWLLLKIYFEKYDNAFGYTGGLGSGKSLRAVNMSIKLLKRNRFKRIWQNIKTFIYNFFHKYKRDYIKEVPMLYASIPVFIKIKRRYFKMCNVVELREDFYKKQNLEKYITYKNFCDLKLNKNGVKHYIESSIELTENHILLQDRINIYSVTFIDEIGAFCSQFEYANPNVLKGLDEFVRLYRHYTKGGYFICTDQCSDNIVKQVRVRLNKVFNLNNFKKYWFLYRVNIREISTSEDIKTIEQNNKEDNECATWGIIPFSRRYDSYCYSDRYKSVPHGADNVYTCLKKFKMFKIPKQIYNPKTSDVQI